MLLRRLVTFAGRSRQASTLVLCEHSNTALGNSTLSAVTAARALGHDVTVLVAGSGCGDAAKAAAAVSGVSRVLLADDASLGGGLAENLTAVLVALQEKHKFAAVIAAASNFGKNVVPRLAAKLDVAAISDVTAVVDGTTFERPMYAGNAIARVKSHDSVQVVTVRPTSFEKASAVGGTATVEQVTVGAPSASSRLLSEEHIKSERPELGSAPVVVSGGRALKSADNFKLLYDLADRMGAAVGASRAAVDAGYAPNDLQVGQTGKVVAPRLYIAAGISGAIQHLAGMKDSKVIVAINKDPDAPIMQVADYALVEDLFKAVPEMTQKLQG